MRVLLAFGLTSLLLFCGGCGVPEVTLVGDDASEAQAEVGPDGPQEAGDDGSLDGPESSTDGGCVADSPPSGYICCGSLACGGQCTSATCSDCTTRCEAGQDCCLRGSNMTCHVAGSGC
jgi:hypothetical protein